MRYKGNLYICAIMLQSLVYTLLYPATLPDSSCLTNIMLDYILSHVRNFSIQIACVDRLW